MTQGAVIFRPHNLFFFFFFLGGGLCIRKNEKAVCGYSKKLEHYQFITPPKN